MWPPLPRTIINSVGVPLVLFLFLMGGGLLLPGSMKMRRTVIPMRMTRLLMTQKTVLLTTMISQTGSFNIALAGYDIMTQIYHIKKSRE